ncbi:MAG: redoxin domain-containing protein [Candidatus Eremiobacteraeota bacterium]|nr:redoxin domain-containing protein [Candidatus Eremiobacteraeota bacterium]
MKPAIVVLSVAILAAVLAGSFRAVAAPQSKIEVTLGSVLSSRDWIGRPPTAGDVAGKVVVLDVFTVDCYNCRNVVPTLRALYANERARGLRIVGVHSPETPAEKGRAYVTQSLAAQGITWPVAVDNAFALWNAYGINAWPTQLFFDRHGRWRKTIVGDSQDADVRATVDALLAEK